jgi:hypothetical protein
VVLRFGARGPTPFGGHGHEWGPPTPR